MTTRIYANHRDNQREWILEVAEDLFIAKGIDKVTIADIATASRLTRATLYRYFPSKEQMAQEIFRIITKSWVERTEREVWSLAGTGYARLEKFVISNFDHWLAHTREARFVAEFNYLYAKEWSVEVMTQLLAENLELDRQRLRESVRQGQADGTIRTDIDLELMVAAIFNFNSGMLSRLGEMGDKIEGEYALSLPTIFAHVCRIFLDGLKAPTPS
jgi:AcrR family transcriptional regulator